MPERTSYDPGTPSWVDLGTTDPDAAKAFYGGVFGWEAQDAGPQEETGGYAFFLLGGKRVAGVMPLMGADQPTAWSTYVSTDDADGVAARAEAAGAVVLAAPMDVMDAGRMAFFMHPAGGAIGTWQPGTHTGAEVVNDPNTFSWSELHTRAKEDAKRFGGEVFGWGFQEMPFAEGTYTLVQVGGAGVGGIADMPPGVPDEVPAYWMTYFAVDDADASVATVRELGGSVLMEPFDVEGVGRIAVVADPQGAQFGIIRNAPPAEG